MAEGDFEKLEHVVSKEDDNPSKDESLAKLEQDNQGLHDHLLEVHFCYIVVLLMLFDSYVFMKMPSWGGPIGLIFLQALLLVIVGRKLGVQDVTMLIDRALAALGRKPGKDT